MSKEWPLPPGVEMKDGMRYKPSSPVGYRYFHGSEAHHDCFCGKPNPGRQCSSKAAYNFWVCGDCFTAFEQQALTELGVTFPRPVGQRSATPPACTICNHSEVKWLCWWGDICEACDTKVERRIEALVAGYEPAPNLKDTQRAWVLDRLEKEASQ